MEQMQVFSNPAFGNVRTIEEDGKVLFCGKDIAGALGYAIPRKAIREHCPHGVKRTGVSYTTNQHGTVTEQIVEMTYIPEGDVYRLITRSKLPAAEKFERWLFDEVVPAVCKTGSYGHSTIDGQVLDVVAQISDVVKNLSIIVTQIGQVVAGLAQAVEALSCTTSSPITTPSQEKNFIEEPTFNLGGCKLERAPKDLRERVDTMFNHMAEEQALNFSAIARFCTLNGYSITSPAVRTYYDRIICGN